MAVSNLEKLTLPEITLLKIQLGWQKLKSFKNLSNSENNISRILTGFNLPNLLAKLGTNWFTLIILIQPLIQKFS